MDLVPKSAPVFQVSGGSGRGEQEQQVRNIIQKLGGTFLEPDDYDAPCIAQPNQGSSPLNAACTHLILLKRIQTEKCLVALARGIYIVDERYFLASEQSGHWLDAQDYDLGGFRGCVSGQKRVSKAIVRLEFERYVRRKRESDQGGKFRGWNVIIGLNGIRREIFKRVLISGGARVLPHWERIYPSDAELADLLISEPAMLKDLAFCQFLAKYESNLRPISTLYISDCLRRSLVDRKGYYLNNPSIVSTYTKHDPGKSVQLIRNSSLPLLPHSLEVSALLSAPTTPSSSSKTRRITRKAESQSPDAQGPCALEKSSSSPTESQGTPPNHPHEVVVATFKGCIDKGALRSHFMDLGGSGFIRKFLSHSDYSRKEHFCLNEFYLSTLKTYIHGETDGPEYTVSLWLEVISFFDMALSLDHYFDQRILNPLLIEGLLRQPNASVQSTVHQFLLKLVNTNQIPNSNAMRMVYLSALTFRPMTKKVCFDVEEPWEFVSMISNQAFDSEDSKTGATLVLDFIARIITIDFQVLETSLAQSEVSLVQTIFWGTDVKVQSIPQRVVELVQLFVTALDRNRWDLFKRYSALLSVVARSIVINHCSSDIQHDLARLVSSKLQNQFPDSHGSSRNVITALSLISPNWLSLLTTMYYNGQFPVPLSLDKVVTSRTTTPNLVQTTHNNNQLITMGDKSKKSAKRNIYGETILHVACKRNQSEKVKAILAEGLVGVNLADNNGWTALHEACFKGSLDCVKALLTNDSQTADLMALGGGIERVTPLEKAVLEDHCEVVTFILEWIHSRNADTGRHRTLPTLAHLLHPEGRNLKKMAASHTMLSLLESYEDQSKKLQMKSSITKGDCDLFHLSVRRYIAAFSLNYVKQLLRQGAEDECRYRCGDTQILSMDKSYVDYPMFRANPVVAKDIRIFNTLKTRHNPPHELDLALQSRLWALSRH